MTADVTPRSASTRPSLQRKCSRTACPRDAVATLTYVYSDSTAVVGPLATYAEPHTYDLCPDHADRLTPPRGWDIVRLAIDAPAPTPTGSMAIGFGDDLVAIADAVREDRPGSAPAPPPHTSPAPAWRSGASRGHLRAVRLAGESTET